MVLSVGLLSLLNQVLLDRWCDRTLHWDDVSPKQPARPASATWT
ncbi:hypothetical protein [Streptomyces sp. A012304]|nr:hypothetical protein [Streptomyces sp. A012304]GKQ35988.1 hypothetical protein ALMP_25310 [Streptomyces sp. A012304]